MSRDNTDEFEKAYEPSNVEQTLYKYWSEKGFFAAPSTDKETFTIVIPPPNVTGSLHLGHALNATLQDIVIRYQRMKGKRALWIPGTDHAGIATQMVVERSLEADNVTRHDLGRDKFIEKVWEWRERYGGKIIEQLKRLGASPDWDSIRFTLDEGLSSAVKKVFVELHREGLIYKDKRLVNWDPKLHTAISDLEVEQKEVNGHLWYFRYPIEGRNGEFITVATTRPETMLGDTAVAVHPEDERYKHLVGKNVILPLVGRPIPIIADEYSDPEKGTGAVKITPAHDFNDFEVGRRNGLEKINIFDKDASLNENVPEKYRGLDRYEVRKMVIEDLEALGFLDKVEDHRHVVPYGDRSGVAIEPWLTDQWYVDAQTLAKPAIEAVEKGEIEFIPKRWVNTYYEWMRNIQPWCISRQIWWGHRIPAWYGPDGHVFVELNEDDAMKAAEEYYGERVELSRDEDVLDTWFSSGLWPFSTLGWPDNTEKLKDFYPTSVLITAFDIIFFWVARMIMMGIKFMGEAPFKKVYIHGLIRDDKGEKMSKSKGNVIDPLDIMDKYGADSMRFTLAALSTQGRDIKLAMPVIEGYRNFMNKIWNASRFLFLNLEGYDPKAPIEILPNTVDKWILTKFNHTLREMERRLDGYEFDKAAQAVYQFIWGDYCDWYIEFSKPSLNCEDSLVRTGTQYMLQRILLNSLQLLHPMCPFITEEIYHRFYSLGLCLDSIYGSESDSIMISSFPEYNEEECDEEAFEEIELVKEIVVAVRNLRAVIGIHPGAKVNITLLVAGTLLRESIERNIERIKNIARVSELDFETEKKPKKAIVQVIDKLQVYLHVEGLIDVDKEVERINKDIVKLEKDIVQSNKKLANKNFIDRAPEDVVEKEKDKFTEFSSKKQKLEEILNTLSELG